MRYKPPRNFAKEYDWYYRPPDDVLRAIGQIAVTCASIEDILHFIHWRYVDTYWAVGPILTGDMKPRRLIEDIIKIAVATEEEDERVSDLKDLFADYRELSEKRNKIMHWIWYQPEKKSRFPTHRLLPPTYKGEKPQATFRVK
jgi:hypothetical protein